MATPPLPDLVLLRAAEAYRRLGFDGYRLLGIGSAAFGSRIRSAIDRGFLSRGERRSVLADLPMPTDEELQARVGPAPAAAETAPPRPAAPSRDIELESLRRQLREAQADRSIQEWARALIQGLDERARETKPAAWTVEPAAAGGRSAGIPTLLLSDFHWGEVVRAAEIGGVNEYNMAIARRRLQRVTEKTCDLLRNHVVGDYPGIVVALGGDMISGAIHDELEQTNDGTVMQQALDLFEHLQTALITLADEFGHVHVPAVTGNHGRSNRKWQAKRRAALSYEWLVYQFLQRAFVDDERFTWSIPDGPDTDFELLGTRYRLTHGDSFKGGDGMIGPLGPITRGTVKRRGMAAAMHQPFDHLLMGHWHTLLWGARQITNGSLKGFDEFAMSFSAEPEPPQQALWLTTERHGRTIQMPVYAE
jgi:hypothetical protein